MARDSDHGRGVRLGDLDRRFEYVLAHNGRRWEVRWKISENRELVPYIPPSVGPML